MTNVMKKTPLATGMFFSKKY